MMPTKVQKSVRFADSVPRPSNVSGISIEDQDLLGILYTYIDEDPENISAHKVLIDHLKHCGYTEAAIDISQRVLKLDPLDKECFDFVHKSADIKAKKTNTNTKDSIANSSKERAITAKPIPRKLPHVDVPKTQLERSNLERELIETLQSLSDEAMNLLKDTETVAHFRRLYISEFVGKDEVFLEDQITALQGMSNGIFQQTATKIATSVRSISKRINESASQQSALEIAILDLEETLSRLEQQQSGDKDDRREALAKRCKTIASSVNPTFEKITSLALMHIEHEKLGKQYVNTETMYGDEVKDIPRHDFWVSEDGYAWSMDELSAAITSNKGVMRNPLSKEMFCPRDISFIVQHPSGKHLAAIQLAQAKMSKGVRPSTIEKLERLGDVFIIDMSEDQKPSRKTLDEFLGYMATLPQAEQDVLDDLRVPAKDSHTGLKYDSSIGESLRDAKANRICIHKAGDLLKQAVVFLRKRS